MVHGAMEPELSQSTKLHVSRAVCPRNGVWKTADVRYAGEDWTKAAFAPDGIPCTFLLRIYANGTALDFQDADGASINP